jgi:hypothetical protein
VLELAIADGVVSARRGPTPFVLREKFVLVRHALEMQGRLCGEHSQSSPPRLAIPALLIHAERGFAIPGLGEPFASDPTCGWGHLLSALLVQTVRGACHFDLMRDANAELAVTMIDQFVRQLLVAPDAS